MNAIISRIYVTVWHIAACSSIIKKIKYASWRGVLNHGIFKKNFQKHWNEKLVNYLQTLYSWMIL